MPRTTHLGSSRTAGAPFLFLCLLVVSACGSVKVRPDPAPGPNADPYAEALVRRARAEGLSRSRQWLRLGHWRLGPMGEGFHGGGYTSEADSPSFFLSNNGKRDPDAEMDATIRGFFRPADPRDAVIPEGTAEDLPHHPICRFPARFAYLQRALNIDLNQLRVPSCARFVKFMQEMDPASATLIFSSYYLNNPASAFGHTFLRINRARNMAVGERRELLDYGIDYSANVDTGNVLIYAFKGIFGLFPGTFHRIPYYYKVREYNDYESRDLWEYDLQLSPQELFMLSAHIWELGSTYFAYYYISENCSYHILGLLEVANPELDLLSHIASPTMPSETIKALYENAGLVRDVRFRPSVRTQFAARIAGLNSEQQNQVEQLARNPDAPWPAAWPTSIQIRVLDAAVDLVDMRHVKDLIHRSDNAAARLKQRLLARRAEIHQPSEDLVVEPPADKRPEHSHSAKRVGLGYALDANGRSWINLDLRLALHDLADPSPGFPDMAQIEFLPLRLRVSPESGRVVLDDFQLVRVLSLSDANRFDLKPSWRMSVGARTVNDAGCDRCLVGTVHFGGGLAKSFADEALVMFTRIDTRIEIGPNLQGIADGPVRAGFGPAGGLRLRWRDNLITLVTAEWLWLPVQEPLAMWQADFITRWQPWTDFAFSLEAVANARDTRAQILSLLYF